MSGKLNKNDKIALVVVSMLTVFGLFAKIFSLINAEDTWDFVNCVNLLLYFCIAWYVFEGYKKPHGNSLKWIMLVFVTFMLISVIRNIDKGRVEMTVLRVVVMLFIVYIAGRLERIEQNKYLMAVVLVLLIVNPIYKVVTENEALLSACIKRSTNIIMWIDLCVAYLIRYHQHKEAGLADAPKKKITTTL